jgi:hypothetical protein
MAMSRGERRYATERRPIKRVLIPQARQINSIAGAAAAPYRLRREAPSGADGNETESKMADAKQRVTDEEALAYHLHPIPGKIEVAA